MLNENVTPNENVMVVNLPKENSNCSGKEFIVSGWGIDRYRGVGRHRYLWAVKQQCVNLSECTRYTGDPKAVLCVTDPEQPENSACHADSGGNNKFVIIEIENLDVILSYFVIDTKNYVCHQLTF